MHDIEALKDTKLLTINESWYADGVSIDTRKPTSNMLFFAIKGEHYDGHDFVKQAIDNGAVGAVINKVYEKKIQGYENKALFVYVNDTIQSLGELALIIRKRYKPTTITITGSNGKTTTKEILYEFLSTTYPTGKTLGNFNNLIGLPLSMLNMSQDKKIWVLELGTSRFGELANLSRIACPDIGILTNIGRAHIEFFKDIEGVARAKSEMFSVMEPDKVAIVNADDPYALNIVKSFKGKVLTAGFYPSASLSILSYNLLRGGMEFEIMYEGKRYKFSTQLSGKHYLYDIALAILCARHLNVEWENIKSVCKDFKPFKGRGNAITYKNGVVLIDDTYNANPDSMINGFLSAIERYGARNIIAVIGDMFELGQQTTIEHYNLGQFLAKQGINKFILIGKFSESTLEGIKSTGRKDIYVKQVNDTQSAVQELLYLSDEKAVIYVKGSRAMRLEEVISNYDYMMRQKNA